jgi:hypothetical protein
LLTASKLAQVKRNAITRQLVANNEARKWRETVVKLHHRDPKRKKLAEALKVAEANLARTAATVQKIEKLEQLRQTLQDGAHIHFRICHVVDGCEVDLLHTADDTE